MKTSSAVWGAVALTLVAACGEPEPEPGLRDPDARAYRMFYDERSDQGERQLAVRRFTGQLRMVDVEAVFGDLSELPRDDAGNHIGGWRDAEGLVWSVVASPSLEAVSLVSADPDGTVGSALDLDGDRIADVLDIRRGDGTRLSFATERLGRELFEQGLLGLEPLCRELQVGGIQLAGFPCPESGGGGAGGEGPSGSHLPQDPFDLLCADYGTGPGIRPPVQAHGGHGYGSRMRHRVGVNQERDGHIYRAYNQRAYVDEDGQHVATYTRVVYYDESGEIVREVRERVDHDGNGTREIIDHGADGTRKTETETFETETDETGSYEPDTDTAPEGHPARDPGSDTSFPDPTDPGSDPGGRIAEWCASRDSFVSGVEQAVATDQRIIELDCDDLVRQSERDPQCELIRFAGAADFEDAIADSDPNCGPFEQPGPDGTCGPASGIQLLKSRLAELASADLEGIEICDPLVCNPGPVP